MDARECPEGLNSEPGSIWIEAIEIEAKLLRVPYRDLPGRKKMGRREGQLIRLRHGTRNRPFSQNPNQRIVIKDWEPLPPRFTS
jgi:hypothetical protein